MSDASNQNRPLSEISHLFLSNVRDLPRPGAARPVRIPPGGPRIESAPIQMPSMNKSRGEESVDLTPEEFAEVFGRIDLDDDDRLAKKPIITAVLASHLAGNQSDRVKEYARHYAVSTGHRVGLIDVDASEFRLTCFEPGVESHAAIDDGSEGEPLDPRHMAETIEELNVDVDRWLLHVINPRLPEARTLLRGAGHWVMLSTCDHDGVVSCYRTLKGLSDLHRPRLALALLDAPNETEANLIHHKLASVCQQFLGWPLEHQSMIETADNVAEHLVMNCRPRRDKAQLAAAPQWQIVGDFLATAQPEPIESAGDSSTDTDDSSAAEAALAGEPNSYAARRANATQADSAKWPSAQSTPHADRTAETMLSPRAPHTEPAEEMYSLPPAADRAAVDRAPASDSHTSGRSAQSATRAAESDSHDRSARPNRSTPPNDFADDSRREEHRARSSPPTDFAAAVRSRESVARPTAPTDFTDSRESDRSTQRDSRHSASPAEPTAFANLHDAHPALKMQTDLASEVVDLPSIDAGPATILSAVIRHTPGQLVECPVRPPMCPDATLAVDREHGLVLLAVAKAGLADFRSIAQAYQWLNQNRTLIGMAVPQFTIDCHRLPQLRLLVDHRDMTAELLQPMLEAGHVTVQAYRKLRWGERTGLLLEAA